MKKSPEALRSTKLYRTTRTITHIMDRWMLDPLLGVVPMLDTTVGIAMTGIHLHFAVKHLGSWRLALAVLYNFLLDTTVGIIPLLGDVLDIFSRSYIRSQRLIDGYIDGNSDIIKKINTQSRTLILLSVLFLLLTISLIFLTATLLTKIF